MLTGLIRSIRIWYYRHRGFSECYCCHTPWPMCKEHTTMYTLGRGCFPLCETCWSGMTPEERLSYYRQLWLSWRSCQFVPGYTDLNHNEEWNMIKEAVLGGK